MSIRRVFVRDGIGYTVILGHWLPRRLGHDAFTFARRIYVADLVLPADLHCHEFQHLQQQRDLGLWRFAFLYLWQARHGYREITFEQEAYEIQGRADVVATFAAVRA